MASLQYFRLGNLELANSSRALAYTKQGGLPWLLDCSHCSTISEILPRLPLPALSSGGTYVNPAVDPAPWYDPDIPETEGFFGVVALDVTGLYDSTRVVRVTASTDGGSALGATYFQPREIVARLLLVGEDECSVNAGLAWLSAGEGIQLQCSGVEFEFFDCCPCMCGSGSSGSLPGYQDSPWDLGVGTWDDQTRLWNLPNQNLEDVDGTFGDFPVDTLDGGLILGEGCYQECVLPSVRRLRNVQMTAGPTVLSRPQVTCGGAIEVEVTLIAGDSKHYTPFVTGVTQTVNAGFAHVDKDERAAPVDPFGLTRGRLPGRGPLPAYRMRSDWLRTSVPVLLDKIPAVLSGGTAHRIVLTAGEEAVPDVRLTVLDGLETVGSFYLPVVPAGYTVTLDLPGRRVEVMAPDGSMNVRTDLLYSGDGAIPVWPPTPMPQRPVQILVDRGADVPVDVMVESAGVAAL